MGAGDAVIPGIIIVPRHFIPWVLGRRVIARQQIKITEVIDLFPGRADALK